MFGRGKGYKRTKVFVQEDFDMTSKVVTANGFGYHFNQKNKNGTHYLVCKNRLFPTKCPARAKIDVITNTFYRVGEHTCHL